MIYVNRPFFVIKIFKTVPVPKIVTLDRIGIESTVALTPVRTLLTPLTINLPELGNGLKIFSVIAKLVKFKGSIEICSD